MHYELITKLQLAYVKPALLHNRHIMCRMKTLCMLGKCRLQFQHRLTMFLLSVVCASRIHIVLVRARSLVEAVQESPKDSPSPPCYLDTEHQIHIYQKVELSEQCCLANMNLHACHLKCYWYRYVHL